MPTLKQPREVAKLKGMDKRQPRRHGDVVPKSSRPLGDPPEYLDADAKDCWFELSALAIPGVMTGADRILLEITAVHLADYRKGPSEYPTSRLGQFILCLARFGMSTSDRTKLGIDKSKEDNPYLHLDD